MKKACFYREVVTTIKVCVLDNRDGSWVSAYRYITELQPAHYLWSVLFLVDCCRIIVSKSPGCGS